MGRSDAVCHGSAGTHTRGDARAPAAAASSAETSAPRSAGGPRY